MDWFRCDNGLRHERVKQHYGTRIAVTLEYVLIISLWEKVGKICNNWEYAYKYIIEVSVLLCIY